MADIVVARSVLYSLIQDSPHTFKSVAERVGESPTTFSKRLRGTQAGYTHLDLALVFAVLDIVGVSFTEYTRLVSAAEPECPQSESGMHEWRWSNFQNLVRGGQECGRCLATRTVDVSFTVAEEADRG